jgi:predicted nucleic acid-binding protein
MIAADTSVLAAFLEGEAGPDVTAIATAIDDGRLRLPPVVITELLSYPKAGPRLQAVIGTFLQLETDHGYWERAGETRRRVLTHGFKARVADALIAQSCIDHKVPLMTRDRDFRHFAKHCGLVLA